MERRRPREDRISRHVEPATARGATAASLPAAHRRIAFHPVNPTRYARLSSMSFRPSSELNSPSVSREKTPP